MPYTVEKLPDEPIIVYTQLPGGDAPEERQASVAESVRLLDAQEVPVFLISDVRATRLDLDGIIQAASLLARGDNALLHHPMIRENIFVIDEGMIKMAINGLSSATFGRVRLLIFGTVEEALAYCRGR